MSVIDALVFHEWPDMQALRPHLPIGWRDLLAESKRPIESRPLYPELDDGSRAPFAPAASVDEVVAWLDATGRERAVLAYEAGARVTAHQNHFITDAVAEAANRWTAAEWLDADERLWGLILASLAVPETTAREIRRAGQHPKMAGILMGAAAVGVPLGHPVYHPIYAAAEELDLPIVLLAGVDATEQGTILPVSNGLPATTGEYLAHAWHTQAAYVSSLVMEGVLDLFPRLRVMLVGAGATWFPGHMWRIDHRFTVTRGDGRWLKRRPDEYADRFWFGTYRLEQAPTPAQLVQVLETIPDVASRLVYGSGAPRGDWTGPEETAAVLPEAWRAGVTHDNALSFFRWSGAPAGAAAATDAAIVS